MPDDQRDKMGRTELMYAANEARVEELDALLKGGADPNACDKQGWTALHFAAQAQSELAIRKLASHGAEVDARDQNGNTPLFRAVYCYEDKGSAIPELLSLGADPDAKNNYDVSPRDLAYTIANYDPRRYFSP